MVKRGIKWMGPVYDSSGYGSATRSYLASLAQREEIDLSIDFKSFETEKTKHNAVDIFAKDIKATKPFDVQVSHFTPDNFDAVKSYLPGVYNIGYTTWETDRLPDMWVVYCNQMNEIWVPSSWNKTVFENSGVTVPVNVIPHIVEVDDLGESAYMSLDTSANTFVFYSIFQWLERKNPSALLRAYLTEFNPDEQVCLVMKTYRINTSHAEVEMIKRDVKKIKEGLCLKSFPALRLFGSLLSSSQMRGLHDAGDCYVIPHRAEGFGIPIAEAMALGKPVIATGYSGNLDFMNKKNSLLIDYNLCPCYNMIFDNYHGKMNWADPSVHDLKKLMRYAFENRDKLEVLGKAGQKTINTKFSSKAIGDLIVKHLLTI